MTICENCGKSVASHVELVYSNDHGFDGRECVFCGYELPHKHDKYLRTSCEYEQYSASRHICYETTTTYCIECGEEFNEEEEKYKEEHIYNSNGICMFCGYWEEPEYDCEHEYGDRIFDKEYYYYDENSHLLSEIWEEYCIICGEVKRTYTTNSYLKHNNSNGICADCKESLEEEENTFEETTSTAAGTIVLHMNDKTGYSDGAKLVWNVTPKLVNNKTMVPLKQFTELLGGQLLEWNPYSKSATILLNGKVFTYTSGEKTIVGSNSKMKNSAQIVDNTMYVELTSIVEATDYAVSYYDDYCVVSDGYYSREMVQECATAYYGADFSNKEPEVATTDKKKAQARIEELEEVIIAGAKNAYKQGTIDKTRRDEIIKSAEATIKEYEKVLSGKKQLSEVSEQEKRYKAVTGSKGAEVEDAQEKLITLSYTSQEVTSKYDVTTFNNIAYFQIINDLEVTGWLDSATSKELERQYEEFVEIRQTSQQAKINGYRIVLDKHNDYATISVECNENTKLISITLKDNNASHGVLNIASNVAEVKVKIPETKEVARYTVSICAYGSETANNDKVQESFNAHNTGTGEYLAASGKQLIFGNFTEDVTLLGTAGQVVSGLIGIDFPMDVRDVAADLVGWEWSWGHAGQTVIDLVAVVPVIGALKYTDEAVIIAKGGSKLSDIGEVVIKHVDEVADAGKYVDEIINFKSADLLDAHYIKHKNEFGNITKEEYLQKANELISSKSSNVFVKTRDNGDKIFYNVSTNEFAVVTNDNILRTYFKPENGIEYFKNQ